MFAGRRERRDLVMTRATLAVAAFLSLLVSLPAAAQQPAVSQLDVNTVPKINADGVRRVQTLLRQKGFESGPLDGVAGPLTKAAVRSFQEKYGMKVSGDMDNQFLLGVGAVEFAGASE
jgi:peptidoglycan hydrolase-like protein with peptidoglycan-binding domain